MGLPSKEAGDSSLQLIDRAKSGKFLAYSNSQSNAQLW